MGKRTKHRKLKDIEGSKNIENGHIENFYIEFDHIEKNDIEFHDIEINCIELKDIEKLHTYNPSFKIIKIKKCVYYSRGSRLEAIRSECGICTIVLIN